MKRIVVVIVLMVGMLAMVGIASGDIVARTDQLFFAEPVPCHVYLKAKDSAETRPNYVPGSFFQIKVKFLRLETDIISPQVRENFIQAQLERHPEYAERYAQRQRQFKELEPAYKALVISVLETLEEPSPGGEIVLLGFSKRRSPMGVIRAKIKMKTKQYMIGYQGIDGRTRGVSVDRNDLYERDDWFLTDLKHWVRRLFSECDNV